MNLEDFVIENTKCEILLSCGNHKTLKCLNCIHNKKKFKVEKNNARSDHFKPLSSCPTGKCNL